MNKFYVVRLDGTPPREVLADFIAEHKLSPISAVWHPDGKRISIWVVDWSGGPRAPGPSPRFWTVPIAGGAAIQTEIDPTIEKQFLAAATEVRQEVYRVGVSFSWSPSGNALYFEASTTEGQETFGR